MSRLKDKYLSEVVKGLQEKYNYKNVMQIPKVTKVVINMAVGEAVTNSKALDAAVNDMTIISGQKPIITKAKKSIAAFKIREGMNLGCKVTLRGERMYEFLDKLMNLTLPRVRDFHGVSATGFDGRGNDITNVAIFTIRATHDLDAQDFLGASVIGNIQHSFLLNHGLTS